MQQEDFYRKIQEKMNHLESNSEWNKEDVWRRINRQESAVVVARKRNLWVYAAAASVIIALGIGLVVMNQTDEKQFVSENTRSNNTEKSIEPSEVIENQNPKEDVIQNKTLVVSNQNITPNENLATSTVNGGNVEQTSQISSKESVENTTAVESVATTVAQNVETPAEEPKHTIAEPKNEEQPAVEAQFQGGKVVVLNIPVAEEEDRGKKKKNVLTKIFKKDSNKPERTDKIWAFVKESFKNDSIEKRDSVR